MATRRDHIRALGADLNNLIAEPGLDAPARGFVAGMLAGLAAATRIYDEGETAEQAMERLAGDLETVSRSITTTPPTA